MSHLWHGEHAPQSCVGPRCHGQAEASLLEYLPPRALHARLAEMHRSSWQGQAPLVRVLAASHHQHLWHQVATVCIPYRDMYLRCMLVVLPQYHHRHAARWTLDPIRCSTRRASRPHAQPQRCTGQRSMLDHCNVLHEVARLARASVGVETASPCEVVSPCVASESESDEVPYPLGCVGLVEHVHTVCIFFHKPGWGAAASRAGRARTPRWGAAAPAAWAVGPAAWAAASAAAASDRALQVVCHILHCERPAIKLHVGCFLERTLCIGQLLILCGTRGEHVMTTCCVWSYKCITLHIHTCTKAKVFLICTRIRRPYFSYTRSRSRSRVRRSKLVMKSVLLGVWLDLRSSSLRRTSPWPCCNFACIE